MYKVEDFLKPKTRGFSTPLYNANGGRVGSVARQIKVDGIWFTGGKNEADSVRESADGVYRYQLFSHRATNDLVVGQGSREGCRNQWSSQIKSNSRLKPFHLSRSPNRFENRLQRSQHTFNGYFERPFCQPFKTEVATCAR